MRHHGLLLSISLAIAACGTGGSDPTFMQVCRVDDAFEYPAGNNVEAVCETPTETIVWPTLPLTVALVDELSDYDESLEEAVAFWHRDVDLNLFVLTEDEMTADVLIVSGSAGDPGLAATRHGIVNGQLYALVEIRKPGDITEMVYVMAHELGHVLGLAHDPQRFSIMHAVIESIGIPEDPDDPEPDPFPNYFITDNDIAALEAAY